MNAQIRYSNIAVTVVLPKTHRHVDVANSPIGALVYNYFSQQIC